MNSKSSVNLQELKYIITNFRTKKYYLVFQILQLILSVIIIISALTNINHFKTTHVLWMQFTLLILMAIDLFIFRWVSEGTLIKDFLAKVDLVIFVIFAFTLAILAFTNDSDQEEDQLLQTDDIIIILVVVSRYCLQIYRMLYSIKQTRTNRAIQKQIKQVDLNVQGNASQFQVQNDEVFRAKITKNHVKNSIKDVILVQQD